LHPLACIFFKEPRYAKVSNPSAHVFSKKNVAWLKIAMNYQWLTVVVQIFYRVHNIDSNIKPLGNAERIVCYGFFRFGMKPSIQVSIGHELENQCPELFTMVVEA
jgi:hypothetical protein